MSATPRRRALRILSIAVPAAVMGALAVAISRNTPIARDEMATYGFALLDPGALFHAVTHVDGVVAVYYFLESLVQHVVPGPSGLRLLSTAGAVGSTALIAAIGSRWWGLAAGATAGLAFAVNPLAVMMAATARPYALATFFVALALWLLDGAVRQNRRWQWVSYAIAVALAGLMHLFALAVVPAFLVLVWGTRRRVLVWLIATATAAIVVLPVALMGYSQRAQVSWLTRISPTRTVGVLADLIRPDAAHGVALAALLAAAVSAFLVFRRFGARAPARATIVSVALLLVPWAVLALASTVFTPVLFLNYVAPSSLGVALVIGAAIGAAVTVSRGRTSRVFGAPAAVVLSLLAAVPFAAGAGFVVPFAAAPTVLDDAPSLAERLDRELRPGDRLVVLQPYPDGGVALLTALYAGDSAWFAELEDQLPSAAQPQVNIRTVLSTDPLVTEAGGGSGRIWILGTTYAIDRTDLPARALSELGCARGGTLDEVEDYGVTLSRGLCRS